MKNLYDLTRRDFIKATGVTAAGLAAGTLFDGETHAHANVPAKGRVIGANDRITYGMIGVGGMGVPGEAKLVAK